MGPLGNSHPLSEGWGRMVQMNQTTDEAGEAGESPEAADDLPELPDFAERVLELTERIPQGRVMTYGDVAEYLEEGGPRQVGRVMALYGGAVPWWRVVRADGSLLPGHELSALQHYRAEGTPLRERGRAGSGHVPRVDMAAARWTGVPEPSVGSGPQDRG